MSDYDECDAIDRADLKREAAAERKAKNHYCFECECHGFHLSGCPEAPEEDHDEPAKGEL